MERSAPTDLEKKKKKVEHTRCTHATKEKSQSFINAFQKLNREEEVFPSSTKKTKFSPCDQ